MGNSACRNANDSEMTAKDLHDMQRKISEYEKQAEMQKNKIAEQAATQKEIERAAQGEKARSDAMIEKVKRHEAELEAALKIAEVHKKVAEEHKGHTQVAEAKHTKLLEQCDKLMELVKAVDQYDTESEASTATIPETSVAQSATSPKAVPPS
jgi:hypothetical protein